ncbi:rhomboid-like protein [Kitasatospora purpeofusca]|uniref:rhomboid-like protein n=1 Tax=Kitasatospora purpeofusca TaxID=67352 RepID=UPI002A59F929|nr:rhomboid-like protein [Kitasatospora purpeofusca]MDY0810387.1 rhomboid-like protein [Kitasatospora purpeofusca]
MAHTLERPPRARSLRGALLPWVRSAPGTYLWLLLLAVTSFVVARMDQRTLDWFLAARSTNLDQLSSRPVHALMASALWTETSSWPLYAVLFTVFHANAERWLGTVRWFAVAATAHVLATLVSEGVVAWGIVRGTLQRSMAATVDVGVSYALAGVVAVLTYRFAGGWRWIYGAGVVVFYLVPLVASHTFTDLGHFSAVLIGLGFFRFAHGRPRWDPGRTLRHWRRRHPVG